MQPTPLSPEAGATDISGPSALERWFVGYTKPRQELRALENLARQGFDCQLPLIQVQRRRRERLSWEQEAMFPRYLFIRPRADGGALERVRSTFGMCGLVRFGGLPAQVADRVVSELLWVGERIREAFFQPGDAVRLTEGPLAGLEGVFQCTDGEGRAIVLLEFLQREQRVAVPATALRPQAL